MHAHASRVVQVMCANQYEFQLSAATKALPAPWLLDCRMSWLLKTLVGTGHPCLFVGESGTSKSVTIASYLSSLGESHITINMNFSSRTSSLDVQHAIEDSIEKRTKVRGCC
jgi:dynein heavy chain